MAAVPFSFQREQLTIGFIEMKKYMIRLIPILILLPLQLFATADGPDYWKVHDVQSDDVLNMRIEPDWKSEKVGEIPYNGKCLQNLGCVGGLTLEESTTLSESEQNEILQIRPRWCRIIYQNTVGWVSARYIREGQDQECYK